VVNYHRQASQKGADFAAMISIEADFMKKAK
jgi:hypothetical protein